MPIGILKTTKIITGAGLILFFWACNPSTSEAYLHGFEQFVERVEKYHKDYNKKDWEWADSRFRKYSEEWFVIFEKELTESEKIKVFELKLKYTSLKSTNNLKKIYRELVEKDLNKAKEKLDGYIEKNLDNDVEKLIEGAKEIGDSAVKVLEEAIEKIEKKF